MILASGSRVSSNFSRNPIAGLLPKSQGIICGACGQGDQPEVRPVTWVAALRSRVRRRHHAPHHVPGAGRGVNRIDRIDGRPFGHVLDRFQAFIESSSSDAVSSPRLGPLDLEVQRRRLGKGFFHYQKLMPVLSAHVGISDRYHPVLDPIAHPELFRQELQGPRREQTKSIVIGVFMSFSRCSISSSTSLRPPGSTGLT